MLWDMDGRDESGRTCTSYQRGAAAAVLVCDLTRPESLEALRVLAEEVLGISPDARLIVAANKRGVAAKGDGPARHPGAGSRQLADQRAQVRCTGTVPVVRIRAQRRSGWVRLWVEDNGIGIAPSDHERIFRPFERLVSREHYAGSGIGLAIVKTAIARLGGQVGVESELETGSRFWLELRHA
jgi:hypothetical protein